MAADNGLGIRKGGTLREHHIMKIWTATVLCLMMLMAGCSPYSDRDRLLMERQMEDHRRIHGDSFESGHTWEGEKRHRD